MTTRRGRSRTARARAEARRDDELRESFERGRLGNPSRRRASLERARARLEARAHARRRLLEIGTLELGCVAERKGHEFLGTVPALPQVQARGRTLGAVRRSLEEAVRDLVARDPEAVVEAMDTRTEDRLTVRLVHG